MKYTIQIMDTDFNTVEFVVEAKDKETAMRVATKGLKAEDIAMSAVFEEGCNISLPIEPVDRFICHGFNLFMIHQHYETASDCTMEEAERLYGAANLKLMMNGRSAHAVMLFPRFNKEVYEVQDEAHKQTIITN